MQNFVAISAIGANRPGLIEPLVKTISECGCNIAESRMSVLGDRIAIMKDGVVVQIGTPEEIVTDPVDSYVREFTEDVPRYKVLSVGKVMRVASDAVLADGTERVNAHAKLDSLIDIATQCDGPLAVVDDENEIIGEIDQAMILKAMDSRS